MSKIHRFEFNNERVSDIQGLTYGKIYVGTNWPVVYIINNDKEAYIGETNHAYERAKQHLQNPERTRLTEIRIISNEDFNKSVILDLESFLINHMLADKKYTIQNRIPGNQDFNYYRREEYTKEFHKIWTELQARGIANQSILDIEKSELFKYSPYKSLGREQKKAELDILAYVLERNKSHQRGTVVINGGAGTGKTVLAIYLMKFFADIGKGYEDDLETLDEDYTDIVTELYADKNLRNIEKIGLVIPQDSLRSSLKDVFAQVSNMSKKMVLSPNEVVKDFAKTKKKFDLLIVDEAHRLKCRNKGNIGNHDSFIRNNITLNLDEKTGNELDWMMLCSNNTILFRDELQMVRRCDIDNDDFNKILVRETKGDYFYTDLQKQWRCEGGEEYINYIRNILSCCQNGKQNIKGYDLRLYSNCSDMIKDIKVKEKQFGLCRVAAGYAWPWDKNNLDDKTIVIQNQKYKWNKTTKNWILSETAMDEIGCIHTLQGYDLNYAGIIIGEDIKYDPKTNEIYAIKDNYYDSLGKAGLTENPKELKEYLIHIYLTLLTRGIKGTYIYVCDNELRKYFAQFINVV